MTRPSALVGSCAHAVTAEEAAFRIDYPIAAARNTCVVALDTAAEKIVRAASKYEWNQATFYSIADPGHDLVVLDGETLPLAGELEDSNALVMISTDGSNAEAAATIGAACKVRGIMTAGLVVTPGRLTSDALLTLRPYARILLVPADQDDLVELLGATRA